MQFHSLPQKNPQSINSAKRDNCFRAIFCTQKLGSLTPPPPPIQAQPCIRVGGLGGGLVQRLTNSLFLLGKRLPFLSSCGLWERLMCTTRKGKLGLMYTVQNKKILCKLIC